MNRIKLIIVAVALAGFVGLLFTSSSLTQNTSAQGKKPKKGAKATPAPTATPQVKAAPKVMPPAPSAAPAAGDTPGSKPSMPPMVKPPTAADTPGSTMPMVKPPTATETPQSMKPPTAPTPAAPPEKAPPPAAGGPSAMARKGPKPPEGNVVGIVGAKGKAVPYASKAEPTEPLLFSTDNDARFIAKAAFDHTKHSQDANYSVTGKTASTCAECHHTDQAATSPGVPAYYKLFERKDLMTSKALADGSQLVSSCRVCHLSSREPEIEGYPPEGILYPDGESDKRDVYGDKALKSEIAYHVNCIVCHERSKQARPSYQFKFLPTSKCTDCHFKAS